ncbi:MAG: hypothetical protein QM621_09555 [Aeromicrobium sp.]|uniref:hypothetical protein n=1 Tax=Aeromicrobium sp. TaxID=1871063 RepID=UPI0039E3F1E2
MIPQPPPQYHLAEPLHPEPSSGRGCLVVVVVSLLVAGVVTAVVTFGPDLSGVGSGESEWSPSTAAPEDSADGPTVDLLTADGFEEVVASLIEEAGTRQVAEFVLYPDMAMVYVPTGEKEVVAYYWDGEWSQGEPEQRSFGTVPFDVGDFLGFDFRRLCDRLEAEGAEECHVSVRAPGEYDPPDVWMFVSAYDQRGEYVFQSYTREGVLVE